MSLGGSSEVLRTTVTKNVNKTSQVNEGVDSNESDAVILHLEGEAEQPAEAKDLSLQEIRRKTEIKLQSVVPRMSNEYLEFMNSLAQGQQRLTHFMKVISQTNEQPNDPPKGENGSSFRPVRV